MIRFQQTVLPSFKNSRKCTAQIVDAIKNTSVFSVFDHMKHLSKLNQEINQEIDNATKSDRYSQVPFWHTFHARRVPCN